MGPRQKGALHIATIALTVLLSLGGLLPIPQAIAQGRVFIEPAVIAPDANGAVRFSVSVDGVPEPGFGSYALTVQLRGPNLRLVSGQVNSAAALPNEVTCSTTLLPGPATVQDLGASLLLQSGQGDLVLTSLGGGSILCTENGLLDGTSLTYNCGVAGPQDVVTPQPGGGGLIDFVCFAGPNVLPGTSMTVTPALFPGESGVLFPFDQDTPIIKTFATERIAIIGAPQNLRARIIRHLVLLQWQGAEGASTFRIFRRLDTESDFVEVGQAAQRVFSDRLPPGTGAADYFVVGENPFVQSVESQILTVVPAFPGR